jgi:hypothetical protein
MSRAGYLVRQATLEWARIHSLNRMLNATLGTFGRGDVRYVLHIPSEYAYRLLGRRLYYHSLTFRSSHEALAEFLPFCRSHI